MNKRKSILYLMIAILLVVLFYNSIIVPLIMQIPGGMGMGMGMHRRIYNNYVFYVDIRFILLLIAAIVIFAMFEVMQYPKRSNRCSKCGYEIRDGRWRICPVCGTPLNKRKGDSV